MKKMKKAAQRFLSLLLVAAMVATSAPQTALTAKAAEAASGAAALEAETETVHAGGSETLPEESGGTEPETPPEQSGGGCRDRAA